MTKRAHLSAAPASSTAASTRHYLDRSPHAVALGYLHVVNSRGSIAGALLLASLSLVSSGAQAQTPDHLEQQAAERVADAVCHQRIVLLGELPEHGEARGFGVKALVVERLVSRCGFRAVLFEAGSYDFFGLERALAATPQGPGGPAAAPGRTDSLDWRWPAPSAGSGGPVSWPVGGDGWFSRRRPAGWCWAGSTIS